MSRVVDSLFERVVGRQVLPFYETRLRGRKTFRYRDEFEANQWRSAGEIADLQWRRVQALLRHAYDTVEYYRSAFDQAGLRPEDVRGPADFARLPVLDKATVRQQRLRLVSRAFREHDLIASATGGSTGEPMRFRYDRNSYERRVAAAMRGDGWAGWRLCGPEFYVWGVPLLPQKGLKRLKTRLHHAGLRRTVVNSFELSLEQTRAIVGQYHQARPQVVIGYANALYEFCRFVERAGLSLRSPRGVISSAEKLYPYQREQIERVFGARVFDRYGCREVMLIAAECEQHDGLHVTADNLFVEVVGPHGPCEPGEPGEVLLTDLHNYGMPLIRYRVGDLGSWKGRDCACGRGLPLLNVVHGRVLDIIRTPAGRSIPGEFFPHLLKDFAPVRRYQVIQEEPDSLRIRLALSEPLAREQLALLETTIQRQVGPELRLCWEMGPDVQIEQRGKFRPVLSRLAAAAVSGSSPPGAADAAFHPEEHS